MNTRHKAAMAIAMAASLAAALLVASPADAYSCVAYQYRAGDKAKQITNAVGVRGRIEVPQSSQVWGYGSGPSAGDIYLNLVDSPYDFVQVGWYVGYQGQLPYASTPHVFYGEANTSTSNAYDEYLVQGPALSWGSAHQFKIVKSSLLANRFDIYMDGALIDRTTYIHYDQQGQPGFVGEINYACTRMHALADKSSGDPTGTKLQYKMSGSWTAFTDKVYTYNSPSYPITLVSTQASSTSTNFSYGGG